MKKVGNFICIKQLGQGQFGTVYKATKEGDPPNKFYAVKTIHRSKIDNRPKILELFETEKEVMATINHPNILHLHEYLVSKKSHYLIVDYCNNGDLANWVYKKSRLSEEEAIYFLKQIMNGFEVLHQYNYMHRDFKLANVFLHDDNVVIGDFGFAKSYDQKAMTKLGTPMTMAPEIRFDEVGSAYDNKCDLWSIGVCFYEMLYGIVPFRGVSSKSELEASSGEQLKFPKDITTSENCKDLLKKLLQVIPELRITWEEFFTHPQFDDKIADLGGDDLVTDFEFVVSNVACSVLHGKKDMVDKKFNENVELMKSRLHEKKHNAVVIKPVKLHYNVVIKPVELPNENDKTMKFLSPIQKMKTATFFNEETVEKEKFYLSKIEEGKSWSSGFYTDQNHEGMGSYDSKKWKVAEEFGGNSTVNKVPVFQPLSSVFEDRQVKHYISMIKSRISHENSIILFMIQNCQVLTRFFNNLNKDVKNDQQQQSIQLKDLYPNILKGCALLFKKAILMEKALITRQENKSNEQTFFDMPNFREFISNGSANNKHKTFLHEILNCYNGHLLIQKYYVGKLESDISDNDTNKNEIQIHTASKYAEISKINKYLKREFELLCQKFVDNCGGIGDAAKTEIGLNLYFMYFGLNFESKFPFLEDGFVFDWKEFEGFFTSRRIKFDQCVFEKDLLLMNANAFDVK